MRQQLKKLPLVLFEVGGKTYYCLEHPIFKGYFGSTTGEVISRNHTYRGQKKQIRGTSEPRLLVDHINGNNEYRRVQVGKEGCKRGAYQTVHRFIAECFLELPDIDTSDPLCPKQRLEVNHVDGDPTNNKVTNLEWVSSRENARHRKVLKQVKAERALKKTSWFLDSK